MPLRTTLFHRWLLRAIPGTFIEHLSDIALDRREVNLRKSGICFPTTRIFTELNTPSGNLVRTELVSSYKISVYLNALT
jgi:hypothetical protein